MPAAVDAAVFFDLPSVGTIHLVRSAKKARGPSAAVSFVGGQQFLMFTGRGKQLTIFVTETDHYHHQALYMAIIEMLRREGCSGATAIRGMAGFGASSLIHSAAILRLSLDQPMVITVVDRPQRIERVIEPLRAMAPDALIIVQDVDVVQSGAPFKEGLPDVKVAEVMRRNVATVHPESPV